MPKENLCSQRSGRDEPRGPVAWACAPSATTPRVPTALLGSFSAVLKAEKLGLKLGGCGQPRKH